LVLRAPSRAAVHAFHETALANGGSDDGPPGLRDVYVPTITLRSCAIPTATV